MWVLEALPGTLVLLLVRALVAVVLTLPLDMLVRALMLLWARTFVPFWVLAQLMLLVLMLVARVQVRVTTLVLVGDLVLVLHGQGSGGANGLMLATMKSGMLTALH